MNNEEEKIAQVLKGHTPEVIALVNALRQLVLDAAPGLVEEGKTGWGNITYKNEGLVCAISPYKKYASLFFYKGVNLSDPQGVLDGSGKAMRHVKIRKVEDIQTGVLTGLIQEAVNG